MKIVCDNCATKYSIADDKVRGKVFKIRCKKCSHIIIVRGTEGGDVPPADLGADASLGDDAAPAPADAASDSVWHLVIDREQIGPMTLAEVRAKFAAGQVDVETYAWREGFGDWLRLGSIDDFRDLGSSGSSSSGAHGKVAPEAATMLGAEMPAEVAALVARGTDGDSTGRSDSADVFKQQQGRHEEEDAAGDLFGNAGATEAATPSSFAAAASSGEDLFGSSGPTEASSRAPASLFGAARAESASKPNPVRERDRSPGFGTPISAAAPADDGGDASARMTGQRNENSVLFSLNNLQALATGGGGGSKAASAPTPGYASSRSEGSGLIDIRAMAAQTLSAAPASNDSGSDIPVLSSAPVFSSVVAAPIMMPTQSSGMPKWVWGVIGGGVLAVGAVAVLLTVVLTRNPNVEERPVVAMKLPSPSAAPPVAAAPPAVAAAPVAPAVPAAKTDAPAATEKVGDEKSEKAEKSKHEVKLASTSSTHHERPTNAVVKKEERPASVAEKPAAVVAAAPARETPKKKGGGDDLDTLLDGATGGKSDSPRHAAAAAPAEDDASLPEQLGKSDIVSGMQPATTKARACYEQFKVPGTAMVKIVIIKSGKVQSASVGGALAGTPSGDCVAHAIRSASFKKFKGPPTTIDWPVMLR